MVLGAFVGSCLMAKIGGFEPEGDRSLLNLAKVARQAVSASLSQSYKPLATGKLKAMGAFVTIEKNGRVLGCRGFLDSPHPSLEQTVDAAANMAARKDPRYGPVLLTPTDSWRVTVTVVDGLQPCREISDLQPNQGLVLTQGNRTGVVLPFEGKDPETRLKWAYTKAGAKFQSAAKLQILTGRRCRL